MKSIIYPILGAAAGVALVLLGAWLSDWSFQRGPDAVLIYLLCIIAGCGGLAVAADY